MKKESKRYLEILESSDDFDVESFSKKGGSELLERHKVTPSQENINTLKHLYIIGKRAKEVRLLEKRKIGIERLIGQTMRSLKGTYPIYSAYKIEEILTYIVYFQTRIEKWIHFEKETLEGSGFHDVKEARAMVGHYWNKLNILGQILVYECDWDNLRYISLSSKLVAIKVDEYPLKIYLDKKVIKGVQHKERLTVRPGLYDLWLKQVLANYQVL